MRCSGAMGATTLALAALLFGQALAARMPVRRGEVCDELCPDVDDPVCGTNGVTYSSECDMRHASCVSTTTIAVLHAGECTQADACAAMVCPETVDEVCDANGVRYTNLCFFERASCLDGDRLQPQDCARPSDPCAVACKQFDEPICGTDGRTYANPCEIDKAVCQQQQTGVPQADIVARAYGGPCLPLESWSTIASFDMDLDGRLSLPEFMSAMIFVWRLSPDATARLFRGMDTNRDGYLTRAEYYAQYPAMQAALKHQYALAGTCTVLFVVCSFVALLVTVAFVAVSIIFAVTFMRHSKGPRDCESNDGNSVRLPSYAADDYAVCAAEKNAKPDV